MTPFDTKICVLGEGPLWHPKRNALFWFDILGKTLFWNDVGKTSQCQFDAHFSAAGWIDMDHLLLASETGLWKFNITDQSMYLVCALDAENPVTRSNDSRADPWGGFWVGTMGKAAEPKAGAIYRFFRGGLRKLFGGITISNAICFAPDKSCAYFTDTVTQKIMRQPLTTADGWPVGDPEVLVDLTDTRLNPDGAVTDAGGNIWVAMWGAGCIVCFAPDGTEMRRITVPAKQPTCPAFGGADLRDLYVTTAADGIPDEEMASRPYNGATLVLRDVAQGLAEPQVII